MLIRLVTCPHSVRFVETKNGPVSIKGAPSDFWGPTSVKGPPIRVKGPISVANISRRCHIAEQQ
jgi:hypothetical protein